MASVSFKDNQGNTNYDVIVVGGGHNGLVCAAYVAKAGHKVKVLERRSVLGGAATTEEFHPGFRNSICSYCVSVLHPKVIEDLELHRYGLEIDVRPMLHFMPLPSKNCLRFYSDVGRTEDEFRRFSSGDAQNLSRFNAMLDRLSTAGDTWLKTPPNVGGSTFEILKALWSNRKVASLDVEAQRDLADLMVMSAGEFLSRWFEDDAVKAILGFRSVLGFMASPYTPGTANVLLHRCVSSINAQKGVWGHVRGGMGSITQAMARAAQAAGAETEVDAPVAEVLAEGGRVAGVRLRDGRVLYARSIAANVNPKLLFLELVDASAIPADFLQRIRNYRCVSGTFRMNIALAELPDFTCIPGKQVQEHHTGSIVIAPSMDYMDEAFQDSRRRGWSRSPIVEMLIPSTIDDTLAPEGAHVASLFAQHFNPSLPDGLSWDGLKEEAADTIIDTITDYAPNFKSSVIARQVLSPLDLEREFGLIGGDIFHGALDLNQIYCMRPTLGYAAYRMPIRGLYLCGAGAHPGGGVSGAPGHNAAREIIRDMGRRRRHQR
jgi:phytoene dehydrogenase-like protein